MKKFWTFKNAAGDSRVGELSIYGPISDDDGMSWLFDDVSPKQFKQELDDLGDINTLNVTINSPGGDVFAGQAIHSMLVRHPATVNMFIDGLAASTASLVAAAGDHVIMPRNAMLMVHDPFTVALGNAREFRQQAEILDTIRESMIAAYQRKTDLDHDELVGLLEAETWLTAEDAVEFGFADAIEEAKVVTASLVRPGVVAFNGLQVSLERFKNPPAGFAALAAPREEDRPPLTKRRAERALVAAGFPHSVAKPLVSRGWAEAFDHSEPEAPASGTLLESTTDGQALNPVRLGYYRSLVTSWS